MTSDSGRARLQPMQALLLATSLLVLPLAFLLFAQWPLRELELGWSRQVNDAAQILFAVYVAVAITAASLAKTHLAAIHGSADPAQPPRRWRATLLLLCVTPWALFMLWAAAAPITNSVLSLEKFGETLTPGYFVIKLALVLLLLLVLIDAIAAWLSAWRHRS